ncbi:hypothetical protein HN419_00640 [Candidatus Woesearchaeota archaeon]|jgi:hypothetical protein|nr:hypothetical protein [Candidatus Woesearchaeota archaeon]MBT3537496.1 hypothetical protein [Candidatus Woesearchaeota archaeon]MBT4717621.1 hypothetical protein [Candidatus Woesearchaeota archaeon]MBT7106194.1 hypothetical protein [Candidatus Woesearchaeota archaeon]MBT7930908.1 hypothetical protein [Candidatus Woesearchaeota archaeon]
MPESNCLECNIYTKTTYCCGSHPETQEVVDLVLPGGRIVNACPNLDSLGFCDEYHNRPEACQGYFECAPMDGADLCDLLGFGDLTERPDQVLFEKW